MVTIIATDVRVKIVENWIIDLQNWQEIEVNSFNYDNEPTNLQRSKQKP